MNKRIPLSEASEEGDVKFFKRLLEQAYTDTEERDSECTDLSQTLAAFGGHFDVGANVEGAAKNGDTALMLAARQGQLGLVKYLVLKGKVDVSAINVTGITATMQAFQYDNVKIGRWLLEHGGSLSEVDKYGNTALHYSALYGSYNAVVFLVKRGISVDRQNNYGCPPMFSAIQGGHLKPIEFLVSMKANLTLKNRCGETCLMYCVRYDQVEILKYLANISVDLNMQNNQGNSALHIATTKGSIEMVKVLLELNICIDLRNKEKKTAMDIADHYEIKELKELFSSKEYQQKKIAKLLNACNYGNLEEAKKLVMKSGVKINGQNSDGDTPLMLGTRSENKELCTFLLEEGANVDLQNKKGQTALHIGVMTGNKKLVSQLLLESPKMLQDVKRMTPLDLKPTISMKKMLLRYISENPDASTETAETHRSVGVSQLGRLTSTEATVSNSTEVTPDVSEKRHAEVIEHLDGLTKATHLHPGRAAKLKITCKHQVLKKCQKYLRENMDPNEELLRSLVESSTISPDDLKEVQKDDREGASVRILCMVDENGDEAVVSLISALTQESQKEGNKLLGELLQKENLLKENERPHKRRKVSMN